jgi:hypothetical protein
LAAITSAAAALVTQGGTFATISLACFNKRSARR